MRNLKHNANFLFENQDPFIKYAKDRNELLLVEGVFHLFQNNENILQILEEENKVTNFLKNAVSKTAQVAGRVGKAIKVAKDSWMINSPEMASWLKDIPKNDKDILVKATQIATKKNLKTDDANLEPIELSLVRGVIRENGIDRKAYSGLKYQADADLMVKRMKGEGEKEGANGGDGAKEGEANAKEAGGDSDSQASATNNATAEKIDINAIKKISKEDFIKAYQDLKADPTIVKTAKELSNDANFKGSIQKILRSYGNEIKKSIENDAMIDNLQKQLQNGLGMQAISIAVVAMVSRIYNKAGIKLDKKLEAQAAVQKKNDVASGKI